MRILISIIITILNHKIKIKTDKIFIEVFIRIFSKIFDKNYLTFNDFSDKIKVDQNLIFSSANMIITKKTIFVIDAVFQITQLKTVNSLLISIKYL